MNDKKIDMILNSEVNKNTRKGGKLLILSKYSKKKNPQV